MSLLLDTCTFIWLVQAPEALSARAHRELEVAEPVYLSSISVYEMNAKHAVGKLKLIEQLDSMVPRARYLYGLTALSFEEEDAVLLSHLPRLHQDPFDRMLLCQALRHDLTILTPDTLIEQYPIKTIW